MGRPAILKVDIIGDARGLNRATGEADSKLAKLGSGVAAVGRVAGAAAIGGIAALGVGLVKGVKAAADYQTLTAKTAAVIKSTGNAANVSVKGIQEHAAALESLSGVDEELILNGQNVLLTFTGVRNEVGRGNDIFDQATKTALNMSTALGQDMQSSAVQLGKALNDPIKGITALSRVGVSFTEQQKEQIATLVANGDTMGAQKVILAELSKEFGGAAEAAGSGFNGSLARVQDALGDTARDIGAKLLPSITNAATWFVDKGLPAAMRFAGTMRDNLGPTIRDVGTFLTERLVPAVRQTYSWFMDNIVPAIVRFVVPVMEGLRGAFRSVSSSVEGNRDELRTLARFLGDVVPPVAKVLATLLGGSLKVAFQTIGTVIGTVISAISTLVGWIDTAIGKIRALKSSIGGIGGKAASFLGFDAAGVYGMTTGPLGGVVSRIGPAVGTLATAAASPSAALFTTTGRGGSASSVVYVDRRSFTATVAGEVIDRVGTALAIRELLAEHETRTGGAPAWV